MCCDIWYRHQQLPSIDSSIWDCCFCCCYIFSILRFCASLALDPRTRYRTQRFSISTEAETLPPLILSLFSTRRVLKKTTLSHSAKRRKGALVELWLRANNPEAKEGRGWLWQTSPCGILDQTLKRSWGFTSTVFCGEIFVLEFFFFFVQSSLKNLGQHRYLLLLWNLYSGEVEWWAWGV